MARTPMLRKENVNHRLSSLENAEHPRLGKWVQFNGVLALLGEFYQ